MSVTHDRCGHRHRPFTPCPHDAVDELVDEQNGIDQEQDERVSFEEYRAGRAL